MTDFTNPDWLCIHKVVNHQCKVCHPVREVPTMTTLERIEQSQGKLLAAIHDTQGGILEGFKALTESSNVLCTTLGLVLKSLDGLRESGMRNHVQVLDGLKARPRKRKRK